MNSIERQIGDGSLTLAGIDELGLGGVKLSTMATGRLRPPDFLVIGAQKAGTTWLHRNLAMHPYIWASPAKEMNYFNEAFAPSPTGWEAEGRRTQAEDALKFIESVPQPNSKLLSKQSALRFMLANEPSDEWYLKYFSHAHPNLVCGESSPDYSVLPRAAITCIARMNPRVRAILIVRDPIDRLWSHIRMAATDGYGSYDLDFFDREAEFGIYLGRTNYPSMIRRWSTHLGAENLLVIDYDDIAARPDVVLRTVCTHLGITYHDGIFPNRGKVVGEGKQKGMPPQIYDILRRRTQFIYDQMCLSHSNMTTKWVKKHFEGTTGATT